MKKVLLFSFVLLLSTSLFAQSEFDKYLSSAYQALNEGRLDDAERQYGVYKNLSKKYDKSFESQLQLKKANSKTVTVTFTVNGVPLEMVWVEGGTFNMGNNDGYGVESPVHSVSLDGFYIGKYEVTQALWNAIMDTTFSDQRDRYGYGSRQTSYYGTEPPIATGLGVGDNYPMYYVSWVDCYQFVNKLNQLTGLHFSLPTEAQWEYAARGGNKSKDYKYSGSNSIDDVAWYEGNSNGAPHPVGQKKPNELGIYDMTGNVSEWCLDWFSDDFYSKSPFRNPVNNVKGSYPRVHRGGDWSCAVKFCYMTHRHANVAYDFGPDDLGLRLVLQP